MMISSSFLTKRSGNLKDQTATDNTGQTSTRIHYSDREDTWWRITGGLGKVLQWGTMKLQFIMTRQTSTPSESALEKAIVPFFRNKSRIHTFQQDDVLLECYFI
ncbi:hypothetical protein B9Z55_026003 [Caenorhabditis nigoni]|uniref:Uncharacterized protein n=1 Tax=Caenorhabditis nigoni TaxID=1611254 RepID=A0A2G5T1M4_9PELO|nr:hypothetical protein B9Z55_026003 [Caenorhabditis nigoni]